MLTELLHLFVNSFSLEERSKKFTKQQILNNLRQKVFLTL